MEFQQELAVEAVREDPRLTDRQKQTEIVRELPGVWVEIASGYRTTMIEMIEFDAVTVQLVRIPERFGTWTSVDNWDGQDILGVRGRTHMAIVHRLRENE